MALVKLAADHRVALWPVSRGKNWGYGSTSAVRPDNIIVVLDRLQRIHVDAELAYAEIEPGVSYRQLHQYLLDHAIPLMVDPIDGTADGSVLGNALDRGHGGTDYGDHYANLCGMEVVLADGRLLHTGGGPVNNRAFHTFLINGG